MPGANDYVTKPFRFPVLLARIRAQLRQHEQSEDAVFQLGPYTFKPAMKLLETEDNRKIRLTEKETNILKFLYRAQDGIVARDILLHEVWGYNAGVTTHTLETHIYRLRQKIEPDPSNARLLVTESRRVPSGCLNALVYRVDVDQSATLWLILSYKASHYLPVGLARTFVFGPSFLCGVNIRIPVSVGHVPCT
jgi:two-component SAPR family response regulator